MTNEEKASEIASKYERWNQEDDESYGAYNGAMEMAYWKDKQFEKVIEYAEICYGVFCFNEREKFIENIKKLYRGEKL